MVEVLKNKKVAYKKKKRVAELCVQTTWSTSGNRIRTPLGMFSGIHTSDPVTVNAYKKQGVKFSEKKGYFVRIMDESYKCIIAFKSSEKLQSAEKQFRDLHK
jgi:hypothetical protein